MRKSWFACFLGTLLVGGLPAAAVLVSVGQQADLDRPGGAAVAASVGAADQDADPDVDPDAGKGSKTEKTEKDEEKAAKDEEKAARGHGPPPWAALGHRGQARGHGADSDWKQAWRELTPAQRERTMADLAKAHAEGMQEWAECVSAAGDDHAQRAACERPLPPGLAKRQP